MNVIEIMARASLTVDYADSEKTHPGITAEALGDDHALEGYLAQAKASVQALHDAGYVVRPMTGKIPVEIAAHEGVNPYITEIRCRADIRDGTLGALRSMDSMQYQDMRFRLDHLPNILADSLLGAIRPQLREDISKALTAAPVVRKGEDV